MQIDSEEDLLREFQKTLPSFQDEFELQEQMKNSTDLLSTLTQIEEAVRRLSLFSPNEKYEDILEEHLELIDLPYYIGLACQKMLVDRLTYIERSMQYFKIYLMLLRHYEIMPKQIEKILEKFLEESNFQIGREEKIELYKLEKILKEETDKSKDKKRDWMRAMTQFKATQAMNKLLISPQEIELLKFRETLEKDPEKKKQFEKENEEYKPPQIKFFKLEPEKRKPNEIITQYLFERGIQMPDDLKEEMDLTMQPNMNQKIVENFAPLSHQLPSREQMQKDIFKPSWTQPKMTLEEHSDLEYTLMMDKQNKQKQYNDRRKKELAEMGIDDEEDSENEMVSDMKTYKARQWDEFTYNNDKGEGNRGNK